MRVNVDGGTRRDGSTKKEKGERNKNIEVEDGGGCRIRNTEGEEKDGSEERSRSMAPEESEQNERENEWKGKDKNGEQR
jgi:hypothetical protein